MIRGENTQNFKTNGLLIEASFVDILQVPNIIIWDDSDSICIETYGKSPTPHRVLPFANDVAQKKRWR